MRLPLTQGRPLWRHGHVGTRGLMNTYVGGEECSSRYGDQYETNCEHMGAGGGERVGMRVRSVLGTKELSPVE